MKCPTEDAQWKGLDANESDEEEFLRGGHNFTYGEYPDANDAFQAQKRRIDFYRIRSILRNRESSKMAGHKQSKWSLQ